MISATQKIWNRGEGGLTLAELLVASTILSVCLLGAYRAVRSVGLVSERMSETRELGEQIRHTFETLGRDLRGAVVAKGDSSMTFVGHNEEGAGLLSFSTLSGDASKWRPGVRPAIRRVTYTKSGGYLMRSETALSGPGRSHSSRLAKRISNITFQFHRGVESAESWNSDEDLPTALGVTLAQEGVVYRTVIWIPSGKEPES